MAPDVLTRRIKFIKRTKTNRANYMNVDKKRKIFTEQKPLNKSILHKCLMNFGIENMLPTTSKLKRNKTYLANTMYYTSIILLL